MYRLVIPAWNQESEVIYDMGRNFMAVGDGGTVSIYVAHLSKPEINMVASFATDDGPCSVLKINHGWKTDKIYILVRTQSMLRVFSLYRVLGTKVGINPFIVRECYKSRYFITAAEWDPRRVGVAVIGLKSGELARLSFGLEVDEREGIKVLYKFETLILSITICMSDDGYIFCLTTSGLFVLREKDNVQIRFLGLQNVSNFDISRFGYMVALSRKALHVFDIGIFSGKSFDHDFMCDVVTKAVLTSMSGAHKIFCSRRIPGLLYALLETAKGDFVVEFSINSKVARRSCRLDPGTIFMTEVCGVLICTTESRDAYMISLDSMTVVLRTSLQFMRARCICDVRKHFVAYENMNGHLVAAEARDGELVSVYTKNVGTITSIEWFSDECLLVLAEGALLQVNNRGSNWDSHRMFQTQAVTRFWVLQSEAICVLMGRSLTTSKADETEISCISCSKVTYVSLNKKEGIIETLVLPSKGCASGVMTDYGSVCFTGSEFIRGEMHVRSAVQGKLMRATDGLIAVVNHKQFQMFKVETLECDGPVHCVPGIPIRFEGNVVYCLSQSGLYTTALQMMRSDFARIDDFDGLESQNFVTSTEDMQRMVNYALDVFTIIYPESTRLDWLRCLVKRRGDDGLSIGKPDEIPVDKYHYQAAAQHVLGNFDRALDCLLEGKFYELANLYSSLYGVTGKDAEIVSGTVNEMFLFGNHIDAYRLLKSKGCWRGCLFVKKLLGLYEKMDDQMIANAREQNAETRHIEDAIDGMESLDSLIEWRSKYSHE